MDGVSDFDELLNAPDNVRKYISGQFGVFARDIDFIESVSANIEYEQKSPGRVKRIIDFIKTIAIEAVGEDEGTIGRLR